VAVTTVYSVLDDGRKGLPKHVKLLTPHKEHKKLHLVGIYMISIVSYLSASARRPGQARHTHLRRYRENVKFVCVCVCVCIIISYRCP